MGFDFWHLSRPVWEPFGREGAEVAVAVGGSKRLHFCFCWTGVLVILTSSQTGSSVVGWAERFFQSVAQYNNQGTWGKPDVDLVGIIHSSVSRCKAGMVGREPFWKLFMASTRVETFAGFRRCCLPQHRLLPVGNTLPEANSLFREFGVLWWIPSLCLQQTSH